MLTLNKNQAIFQLEQVLNKVKDCRYKSLTKFTTYFTEAERDALQYAIDFMKNENNDADNIYKIKQDYDKKLKEEIQERCDHEWIGKLGLMHVFTNVLVVNGERQKNFMNVIKYEYYI